MTVFSFAEPPPGWRLAPLRRPDGRFRGVVYSGGSIPVGRYADFRVLGTPFEEGLAIWPVRQTYADGQVKPWTGPPEPPGGAEASESGPTDPGPAAAVEIGAPGSSAAGGAASDDDDGGSDAGIRLGVIAIGISLLAAAARLPLVDAAREAARRGRGPVRAGRPAPAARPGHVPAPRRADARRLLQRRLLHLHPGGARARRPPPRRRHAGLPARALGARRGWTRPSPFSSSARAAAWATGEGSRAGTGWRCGPCTTGTRSSRGRRCSRSRATTACSPTSRRCTWACWRAARSSAATSGTSWRRPGQADPVLPRALRPLAGADRRRLGGPHRRRDRRLHRRPGVLVGRQGHGHGPARADRGVRRRHGGRAPPVRRPLRR